MSGDMLTSAGFMRLDAVELATSDPPEVNWLLDGLLERGEVVNLVGAGKAGKSLMAMFLGIAAIDGSDLFLGLPVEQVPRLLYLDAENRRATVHRRLHLAGVSRETAERIDYYVLRGADLGSDAGVAALESLCQGGPVVVLDSMVGLHRSDENNAVEVRQIVAGFRSIAERTGATFICLAHENRSGNLRGSLDWRNAADATLELKRDDEGWRTLKLAERRDGPDDAPACVFRFTPSGDRLLIETSEIRGGPTAPERMGQKVAEVLARNPELTQTEVARKLGAKRDSGTFRRGWAMARANTHGTARANGPPPYRGGPLAHPQPGAPPLFVIRNDPDDPAGRSS